MATRYALIVRHDVSSTQDVAFEAFEDAPVLVVAERQHQGRGRSGAEWQQPDRGIFASLAFELSWPTATWPRVTLMAGMAARDVFGTFDLKWPNDLLRAGRKVGGILTEVRDGVVAVGMGVNLWWRQPPEFAAALYELDPGFDAAPAAAERWAASLLQRIEAGPEHWGAGEYRAACATLGTMVSLEGESGLAVGVDADGRLLVETAHGREVWRTGAVSALR
jgi:BirA family biotin operon repressor/biotin-[acetyl-CoA-carboxylase] ligase